jgi:hypothetical protein
MAYAQNGAGLCDKLLLIDAVGEWAVQAETNLLAERKIGLNGTFANSITY